MTPPGAFAHPLLEPLRRILGAAGCRPAWLVGGALRDAALGLAGPARDLDLALPGDGGPAAQRLAAALGGSAFALDAAGGVWRVALPDSRSVDLVPLRRPTIEADLRARDFTVNALAQELFADGPWLDPTGGLADLAARVLRPCGPTSLQDDPLRVLRAYRFAAALELAPVPGLAAQLQAAAPELAAVADERVRTELFAILGGRRAAWALRRLAADGVLAALFPFVGKWPGFQQGDYHAYDLLEHSLRTAEWAEWLALEPAGLPHPERLHQHLETALEAGVTRRALLLLCAFLHDVAKPAAASWDGPRRRFIGHEAAGGLRVGRLLRGLRVGRRTATLAQRVVGAHLRLFQLAAQEPTTRRARLRYLKDLGDAVPEAVLLSLADELATGPNPPHAAAVRAAARELLALHWERLARRPVEPLLRGRDLVEGFGVAPGPQVGATLRAVEAAERAGRVTCREEALALARRLLSGPQSG